MNFRIRYMLVASALLLGGCATDKFACPNPSGVTCMSAPDVYTATNEADHVTGLDPKQAKKRFKDGQSMGGDVAQPTAPIAEVSAPAPAAPSAPAEVPPVVRPSASNCCHRARPQAGLGVQGDTLVVLSPQETGMRSAPRSHAAVSAGTAAYAPNGAVEAYREQAKIMRIYIAPWQDQGGDLHMGDFIYSEITPRQWSVARHEMDSDDNMFQLLGAPGANNAPAQPQPAQGPASGAAQGAASGPDPWQAGSQNTQQPRQPIVTRG